MTGLGRARTAARDVCISAFAVRHLVTGQSAVGPEQDQISDQSGPVSIGRGTHRQTMGSAITSTQECDGKTRATGRSFRRSPTSLERDASARDANLNASRS